MLGRIESADVDLPLAATTGTARVVGKIPAREGRVDRLVERVLRVRVSLTRLRDLEAHHVERHLRRLDERLLDLFLQTGLRADLSADDAIHVLDVEVEVHERPK
jgi:hypothetical protein